MLLSHSGRLQNFGIRRAFDPGRELGTGVRLAQGYGFHGVATPYQVLGRNWGSGRGWAAAAGPSSDVLLLAFTLTRHDRAPPQRILAQGLPPMS